MRTYDVIVVGAGMMGSSAARHLAGMGRRVALVGPDEPADKASHQGVFGSHYDEARITRKLDPDADWAKWAGASIDRYEEIETAGGQRFFHECGSLIVGSENGDFIADTMVNGRQQATVFDVLNGNGLAKQFPCFQFPDSVTGLFEPKAAGWISPRGFVRASIAACRVAGVNIFRQEVTGIEENQSHVEVNFADGTRLDAQKVIVACGGFSQDVRLLPKPIAMQVYARTVALVLLDDAEVKRLAAMPPLIYLSPDGALDVYLLPPVRYPDGRFWLKIGGDPVDVALQSIDAIKAWFRSEGSPEVRDFLVSALRTIMPELRWQHVTSASCVTSWTVTGKPIIARQSSRILALTGCCGKAAKSADELGRLAACAL